MNQLTKKNLIPASLAMTVLAVILQVIAVLFGKFAYNATSEGAYDFFRFIASVSGTLIPVLLLLNLIALLIAYKAEGKFSSRWAYVSSVIFYIIPLKLIGDILYALTDYDRYGTHFLVILSNILTAAGFILLFFYVINAKNSIFSLAGGIALILSCIFSYIITPYGSNMLYALLSIASLVLFILLTLNNGEKASVLLRNIFLILMLVALFAGNMVHTLGFIAFAVLAFLIVPGKIKINFSIILGIIYILVAIGAVSALPSAESADIIIASLIAAAGSIVLTVSFFGKKSGALTASGFGLMVLSFVMLLFGAQGFFAFADLTFIASPDIFIILATVMLIIVSLRGADGKNSALRTSAIVLAAIAAAASYAFIFEYVDAASIMRPIYSINLILSAIVMVPFTYKKYQGIGKHIFLSIITFGIWQFIWVFHVTKNLNGEDGTECRKPVKELLLYMFLPFYSVYWTYKTAGYIDIYAKNNGKDSNIKILAFVFSCFNTLISSVLIQNIINEVEGTNVKVEASCEAEAEATAPAAE